MNGPEVKDPLIGCLIGGGVIGFIAVFVVWFIVRLVRGG